MRVNYLSRAIASAKSAALAVTLLTVAQAAQHPRSPETLSNIGINNFGCINDTLYRGAQPAKSDYADLAALGVRTVVDLQQKGERNEQQLVEAAGMKFFRIGLSDSSWPGAEQAEAFLKIVNDPKNQPVFIHCHGGRHRAGAMTAIYRMTHDGWNADQAYAEMKKYEFERGLGHGALRDYVYDYYAHLGQKRIVVTAK